MKKTANLGQNVAILAIEASNKNDCKLDENYGHELKYCDSAILIRFTKS